MRGRRKSVNTRSRPGPGVTPDRKAYNLIARDKGVVTNSNDDDNVKAIVKRAATEAGFDLTGIAPATDAAEHEYFPEWIAAGHAGEMKYLEARDDGGDLKRASLAR